MVTGKILVQVADDMGVKEVEKLLLTAYQILEKAAPLIAASTDASAVEKATWGAGTLVLPAMETAYKSVIDLNKDGVIG